MIIQINITGNAYLQVKKPDLTFIYTLSRQFKLNDTAQIATTEGYILQSEITVPAPFNEPIRISETGAVTVLISNCWAVIGQIIVAGFEHADMLEDLGDGYFGQTDDSGDASTGVAGVEPFEGVTIYGHAETSGIQRPIAVLDEPAAIGDFIIRARMIVQFMNDNTDGWFDNVTPSLGTVINDTNTLETAETTAKTHSPGSTAKRNIAYKIVLRDLQSLQICVQLLADNADSIETAIAIINASGFKLKTHSSRTKDPLTATNSKTSGTILLKAKAVKGAGAYEWQLNFVGTSWRALATTLEANTKVKDLTPGMMYHFRCRPVTKTPNENPWSEPVSIIVT